MTDNNHQIKNFTSTTDSLKYSTYTHREKSGKHAGHIILPHKVMTLPEVESRTQGSRPRSRSRTPKNFEAKDRPSRGQGQGPRTQTQVFSKKKRLSKIFFRRSLLEETKKKVFEDFPQGFWRFPTKFQRFKNSAVLEPRAGQFSRTWGFETKAKDFKMCPRGRSRGQERPRGLHLWTLQYMKAACVVKWI